MLEGEPYYHFRHRGTRQKSLSKHWGWNQRLTREPKVEGGLLGCLGAPPTHPSSCTALGCSRTSSTLSCEGSACGRAHLGLTTLPHPQVLWFEQQTAKRRVKRSVSVVPTDPWFPKQWYMVRFCLSLA